MSSATCPSCGSSLPQQTAFCPHCGATLDVGVHATVTSPPPEGLRAAAQPAPARRSRPALTPSSAFDHGRFSPGTLLGDRYRIVGLLGRGGMGEVYRADDLQLGQPVALKFLPEDVERDPARLERFVAEVRTARQISHPNVCRVYDIGEVEGRRFLSMEYIDGEDLRSLLRRIGRLPEDKGFQIARQVCAGLAAMHDRGVLHRDLKPANVMLDGDGRARLTDFGLATAVTSDAGLEIAGTPAYMAPEQLAGESLSVQTDLYALGLLLYELFTGERVHQTDRPAELRELHRAGRAAPLSKSSSAPLNPAIARVIERCLERDPKKRPAGALRVAAALPGGDPLAAALAAGETPSPQMVAASGEEGALSPTIGVSLLIALLILTGGALWLNGRQLYTSIVPFPHSSEVLATKAREMLARLGYQEPPADSGFGFETGSAYIRWLEKQDSSRNRWQLLGAVRPPVAHFWYRTSPRPLEVKDYFGGGPGVRLTQTDPPLTLAGMTFLELDLAGRLVGLHAVLPAKEAPATPGPAPDWSRLFVEAGLEMPAFRTVGPEWIPPAGADARAAWVGPGADARGDELRVEAASHRGRPVFFKLVAPWTEPAGDTSPRDDPPWFAPIIFAGIMSLTIALAIRNTRTGRADQRSARRLAVAVGLIVLANGMVDSRLVFSFDPAVDALFMIASWAAIVALLMWMFYTALEPYARRRWPQMLISWSRLLEGRWRDPLIGRDLLIGSVVGIATSLLYRTYVSLNASPAAPTFAQSAWMGLGRSFSEVLESPSHAMWVIFSFMLLLVGLRIVLRTERLAIVAFSALVFAGFVEVEDSPLQMGLLLVYVTLLVVVPTRFGLMAMLAMFVTHDALDWSGASLTPPAPLVGPAVLGVIVMLAPGLFGFYTSRARRSSASPTWLDE